MNGRLTRETLDHPEVGILDPRQEGLLRDLVGHFLASFTKTGNGRHILVVALAIVLFDGLGIDPCSSITMFIF